MEDLFLEWAPYDTEIFSNRYIDPFDLNFMKKFQQDIEVQHEPKALMEKIAMNMNILENVAAGIFRLISSQVKGTPLDMKVDPYTIRIDAENKVPSNPAKSDMSLDVDPDIQRDVELLWFYEKKKYAQ